MKLNMDVRETERQLREFVGDVTQRVMQSDFTTLAEIARVLIAAKVRKNMVFTLGNGGSASTAGHLVNDMTKGCRVLGREGFASLCLNDPSAIVTCLANDFSYDVTYSMMLKTLGRPGDVLVAFSGSGNSPSSVNALKQAREMGIATIGFGGRDGGQMKEWCDICMISPTDSMEKLEDMHMLYCHSLVCIVRELLLKEWDVEILRFPDPKAVYKKVRILLGDAEVPGLQEFIELVRKDNMDCAIISEYAEQDSDTILFVDAQTDASFAEGGAYVVGIAADAAKEGIGEQKRVALTGRGVDAIVPSLSNPRSMYNFLFAAMKVKEF